MVNNETAPWMWWVKVRDAPDAPETLTMHGGSGGWRGWWANGRYAQLGDDDMRRYGYERCCCSPVDRFAPADNCPAHGHIVTPGELQVCLAGMD